MSSPSFEGQVWFDFVSRDVWIFYRFVRYAAEHGVRVALDWQPLPDPEQQLAMSTYLAAPTAEDRGRFLHAMLGLVHLEGMAASDVETVRRAAAEASVEVDDSADLTAVADLASTIGVMATPSLYRHGPPLRIVLNGAVLTVEPRRTVDAILQVSESDGIWRLEKP